MMPAYHAASAIGSVPLAAFYTVRCFEGQKDNFASEGDNGGGYVRLILAQNIYRLREAIARNALPPPLVGS